MCKVYKTNWLQYIVRIRIKLLRIQFSWKKINKQLEIIKRQIHDKIEPATTKEQQDYQNRLDSIILVLAAEKLILQNNRLDKSIRILAQDVILNDFTYKENNNNIENIQQFWKNNINELYKQIQEYYAYGFGASEIIFDNNHQPIKIYQIPAKTLYI